MTIRRLVIAALLASAGAAQGGTIPSTASSPKIVSGWTTGNGTNVLGSGVLQGNLNLIGGVSYTSGGGANVSLADVLFGKVAGTVGEVEGKTTLFFQRGIEANYLLASGHGVLAATVGAGKSVVGSADGAVISDGLDYIPVKSGGGLNPIFGGAFPGGFSGGGSLGNGKPGTGTGGGSIGAGGSLGGGGGGSYGGADGGSGGGSFGGGSSSGSGGGGASGGSGSGGAIGGGSGGGSFSGGSGGSSAGSSAGSGSGTGSSGGGSGTGSFGGGSGGAQQGAVITPVTPGQPVLGGITQPVVVTPMPAAITPLPAVITPMPAVIAPLVEVPEPSSIALMLAGMMGAGAFARRRKH